MISYGASTVQANGNINDLQLTIHMPIKLTCKQQATAASKQHLFVDVG